MPQVKIYFVVDVNEAIDGDGEIIDVQHMSSRELVTLCDYGTHTIDVNKALSDVDPEEIKFAEP